jgi:hypothetical protein
VGTSGFTSDPPKPIWWLGPVLVLGILFLLFGVSLGPMTIGGPRYFKMATAQVQTAHAIGIALYSYANDNDQMYPDGSSSTEAFQKLLDGGYITDPNVLYIPMPGKVAPKQGEKLKPENVCWDLTAPISSTLGSQLPLLFMTGYKVNYVPGGAATPLHGIPQYGHSLPQAAWQQWMGLSPRIAYEPSTGIAVFYVNNAATFHSASESSPDGSIPNFLPLDFKPDGNTYRQLTPDGVLK